MGGSSKSHQFKPFLAKGLLFLGLLNFAGFIILYPAFAEAGFLSDLVKFFKNESKESELSSLAAVSMPLLGSQVAVLPDTGGPIDNSGLILSSTQDNALIAARNPNGTLDNFQQDQILVYTVKPGDVPSLIAEQFGISLNTLLWANNISNPNLIKVGDELIILPVSGVKYEVKKGDTIESIAKKLKGDPADILSFNGLAIGESLQVGTVIIIPDGELILPIAPPSGVSRFSRLPEFKGYYMRPVVGGKKSRGLHGYNGVDLAVNRGSPLFSSAEGTVIIARTYGWNGGYGKYIVVAHPNKTQTLYAHLDEVSVAVGQQVAQGETIGLVGSTGNSTGPHVHFEIRGARNPF